MTAELLTPDRSVLWVLLSFLILALLTLGLLVWAWGWWSLGVPMVATAVGWRTLRPALFWIAVRWPPKRIVLTLSNHTLAIEESLPLQLQRTTVLALNEVRRVTATMSTWPTDGGMLKVEVDGRPTLHIPFLDGAEANQLVAHLEQAMKRAESPGHHTVSPVPAGLQQLRKRAAED